MTEAQPISNESVKSEGEVLHQQPLAQAPIDRILQRLSGLEFPAKEHFERYLRHKWRINHKPRTLQSSFTSVMLFLSFYGELGKQESRRLNGLTWKASLNTSRTGDYVSPRFGRGWPALSHFCIF